MGYLIGLLVALALSLKPKRQQGDPKKRLVPKKPGDDDNPPAGEPRVSAALFWAHKTDAGFSCVGFCTDVQIAPNGQVWARKPQLIEPGFIDPAKMPDPSKRPKEVEGHKWGWKTGRDILISSVIEMQEVANGAGAYLVLQPLNAARLTATDTILEMLLTHPDADFLDFRRRYDGKDKSFTLGREYPFKKSDLYRTRANAPSDLNDYTYPVLVELHA